MKRRTVHALPNRVLPSLRGFEKLPLRTSRASWPWIEPSQSNELLLKTVAAGTSRVVSVLEAMAPVMLAGRMEFDSLGSMESIEGGLESSFGGRLGVRSRKHG
jgi:hypothetical protein